MWTHVRLEIQWLVNDGIIKTIDFDRLSNMLLTDQSRGNFDYSTKPHSFTHQHQTLMLTFVCFVLFFKSTCLPASPSQPANPNVSYAEIAKLANSLFKLWCYSEVTLRYVEYSLSILIQQSPDTSQLWDQQRSQYDCSTSSWSCWMGWPARLGNFCTVSTHFSFGHGQFVFFVCSDIPHSWSSLLLSEDLDLNARQSKPGRT